MKILAIDTSCDDTSIAVIEKKNANIKILSNIVSSQVKLHSQYGGVYPMLAKREHQNNLAITLEKTLKKSGLARLNFQFPPVVKGSALTTGQAISNFQINSKIKILSKILQRDGALREKTIAFLQKYQKPSINAIAITNGPGLEPCLWQGVNFAKTLAFYWDLPLIPVNHIKAHLAANWLMPISAITKKQETITKQIKFPTVGLVASGGHTELVYMPSPNQYKIIGSTRDDAAGECFDKTARILGLGYPGGPAIAAQAANFKVQNSKFKVDLPRPMINSQDFDFSFSGLKTAVLYNWQKQKKEVRESQDYKTAMAKEIQQSIVDVLISKTLKASQRFGAKTIITGGGVASNKDLRQQFKIQSSKFKVKFHVPPVKLCLDNGAMVGACALLSKTKLVDWQKIKVNANLNI